MPSNSTLFSVESKISLDKTRFPRILGVLVTITEIRGKEIMEKTDETKQPETVTFSASIRPDVLEALRSFCKERGLIQSHFVSKAIMEKIEVETEREKDQ